MPTRTDTTIHWQLVTQVVAQFQKLISFYPEYTVDERIGSDGSVKHHIGILYTICAIFLVVEQSLDIPSEYFNAVARLFVNLNG
jgi:hypothetical protein